MFIPGNGETLRLRQLEDYYNNHSNKRRSKNRTQPLSIYIIVISKYIKKKEYNLCMLNSVGAKSALRAYNQQVQLGSHQAAAVGRQLI